MIRNDAYWRAWEAEFARRTPVDFARNLEVMEAMYEHAVAMGAWNARGPLDGLESRLEMARILNVRRDPGKARARP